MTFPTGLLVDAEKDAIVQGFTPLNDQDKALFELCESIIPANRFAC